MKVRVRYLAQFKQAAGVADEVVELPAPARVRALLLHLAGLHGEPLGRRLLDGAGQVQPTILIFLGDEQAGLDDELRDGAEVTLLSPIAGGRT